MAYFALILDANGNGIGSHAYGEAPETYPANEVPCTQAQAQNATAWKVAAGVLAAVPPSLAQQAAAALGAGLTITLSGTMTLAATAFPTDPTSTGKITAVVTAITADGTFPGGASTFPMKDSAGTWHTFTVSQYKAVAGALAAYAAALDLIIDGNPLGATALPASSVSLTV